MNPESLQNKYLKKFLWPREQKKSGDENAGETIRETD